MTRMPMPRRTRPWRDYALFLVLVGPNVALLLVFIYRPLADNIRLSFFDWNISDPTAKNEPNSGSLQDGTSKGWPCRKVSQGQAWPHGGLGGSTCHATGRAVAEIGRERTQNANATH